MIPVRLILLLCCLASCRAQFKDYLDVNDGSKCGEEQFECDNGDCVLITEICDGKNDCPDGSDELFCLEKSPVQCNETIHFECERSNMCIPLTSLCDTVNDCEDGSDEAHCIAEEKEVEVTDSSNCKGFICKKEKKCISKFWACDGVYDCKDKSDENIQEYCRNRRHSQAHYYGHRCYVGNEPRLSRGELYYKCLDKSFCVPPQHVCDGLKDCRDGSDEGPFCETWNAMCTDTTCAGNKSEVGCFPHRDGPQCLCLSKIEELNYNKTTHLCDPINPCSQLVPLACSQICTSDDDNKGTSYKCSCAEGYKLDDKLKYTCEVEGYTKPMIFMTSRSNIIYGPASFKNIDELVFQKIKQAHGVTFDGEYIYWVQTEEGHQAILRAKPNDFETTKQVIISIGLEDPGDIAVDFFGDQIYFTDVERGVIFVCTKQAEFCATVKVKTVHPRFITLDSKNGKMYWADKHSRPVIMTAKMDGSDREVLVDYLMHFPTGLTLDSPSDRLYFIDGDVMVVRLSDRTVYALYRGRRTFHPYSLAVFENKIFLGDLRLTSLQTMDKIFPKNKPTILFFGDPILGMHVYHDVLKINHFNPCRNSKCSHFCFLTSNETHVCGCPDDMTLTDGSVCIDTVNERPRYLIIGGGHSFTRIDYNKLSNPHLTLTSLNIRRVQAMAYDSKRDSMYLFDGGRKKIVGIKMDDYDKSGKTFDLVKLVANVIDMHYDYVTDTLYFLDAARSVIEVVSLESGNRAPVYRFERYEMPVSFCIAHDYGTMLVAIMETEEHDTIHIDSIGLDGKNRKHLITSGLVGPRVKIRYSQLRHNEVYISDETRGNIEIIHPEGTGRRIFRKAKTAIADMSVSERLVFWTDKHTERLFWADAHVEQEIRRMELPSFNSDVHLHLLVTYPPPDESSPLMQHPCFTNNHTCSSICVQTSHPSPYHTAGRLDLEYTCLCPINEKLVKGKCVAPVDCKNKYYCHLSNTCFTRGQLCDGKKDCPKGEDEMGCDAPTVNGKKTCNVHEKQCGDKCILLNDICNDTSVGCEGTLYKCRNSGLCIERSQVCNGHNNCPEGDDELHELCNVNQCLPTEFMCTSIGNCILNTFRCDGDADCFDNSDELNCEKKTCGTEMFQCLNGECIEESQRCDGHDDCVDFSDEDECHKPVEFESPKEQSKCQRGETPCEFNTDICMRDLSWCDGIVDCPGETDEMDCNTRPCRLRFECKTKGQCVNQLSLCDGKEDCEDGSDEDLTTCDDNRCSRGYICPLSMPRVCIEWGKVCDGTIDCEDGDDEGGLCSRACLNNTCSNDCQATPYGPHCLCPKGYEAEGDKCVDVDECDIKVGLCSQGCQNVPGSFACHCYHGYTLRSDGRSCKATKGEAHFIYANGNTIKSLSFEGEIKVLFSNDMIDNITGLDYNYYNDKMYIVTEQGKLIEVNGTQDYVSITNVGKPTKLAVDWVTGNVYFFDNTTDDKSMRVCNFEIRRCAKLSFTIKPTEDVCGIITDPSHRKLYTCVYDGKEFHKIWVSSLDGYGRTFLEDIYKYPSLALDSHANALYLTDGDLMGRVNITAQKSQMVVAKNRRPMSGMVLFEDYIYYYAPRVGKFSACQNYGSRYCAYIYSLLQFDEPVAAWALKHQSVQRDDLTNDCVGFVCAGVCVLGDDGPVCLCPSGDKYNQDETCSSDHGEVAEFETWSHVPVRDHTLTYVLMTVFLTLLLTFAAYFYYYHYYQANAARNAPTMPVSFHNVGADEGEPSTVQIDVPGGRQAAVNPFQILQDFWNQSIRRRRRRPIGTEGLSVDVPKSAEEEPIIVASSSHTSTDESNSDETTKTTVAKLEAKASTSTSDSEIETAFRTYRLQP